MFDEPMYGYGSVQLNRVSGLDEVSRARIPRSSTVPFFHSSEDIFFIKSSDSAGMVEPIRAFRFEEIPIEDLSPVTITQAEFNRWKELLEHAEHIIQSAAAAPSAEDRPAGAES